jgi:hypothetical protein
MTRTKLSYSHGSEGWDPLGNGSAGALGGLWGGWGPHNVMQPRIFMTLHEILGRFHGH